MSCLSRTGCSLQVMEVDGQWDMEDQASDLRFSFMKEMIYLEGTGDKFG